MGRDGGILKSDFKKIGLRESRVRVRILVKSPKIGHSTENYYKSQRFKRLISDIWQLFKGFFTRGFDDFERRK